MILVQKNQRKKKYFYDICSLSMVMGFRCNICGEKIYNKGVIMNFNDGVWKQEFVNICGKKRIYIVFLEVKLVRRFIVYVLLEFSIGLEFI